MSVHGAEACKKCCRGLIYAFCIGCILSSGRRALRLQLALFSEAKLHVGSKRHHSSVCIAACLLGYSSSILHKCTGLLGVTNQDRDLVTAKMQAAYGTAQPHTMHAANTGQACMHLENPPNVVVICHVAELAMLAYGYTCMHRQQARRQAKRCCLSMNSIRKFLNARIIDQAYFMSAAAVIETSRFLLSKSANLISLYALIQACTNQWRNNCPRGPRNGGQGGGGGAGG